MGLQCPWWELEYNISNHETRNVVENALSIGYRSIDTAAMYYNEKAVGEAVRCSD